MPDYCFYNNYFPQMSVHSINCCLNYKSQITMLGSLFRKNRFCFSKYLQTLYQRSKQAQTPFFTINSSALNIIEDPLDFYLLLKHSISHSTHRIGLSCLYLSTGPLQRHLLDKMKERHKLIPDLQSVMAFDYNRSNREQNGQSPMVMLTDWAQQIGNKTSLAFLKIGYGKGVIGEVLGVHHQKIYIFDDRVVLSGANLSKNYFLNRRDRCISIQSPQLSDYLYQYLQVIAEHKNSQQLATYYKLWKYAHMPKTYHNTFSQQLEYLNNLKSNLNIEKQRSFTWQKPKQTKIIQSRNAAIAKELGTSIIAHQPLTATQYKKRKESVRDRLFGVKSEDYIQNQIQELGQFFTPPVKAGKDIYLFPFIQWSAVRQNQEYEIFSQMIKLAAEQNHLIRLISGYLNLDSSLLKEAAKKSKLDIAMELLCSAPQANSFFKAGGFKSYVPVMYRCYEWQILKLLGKKVDIRQFSNRRWSYHAKGIWIQQAENSYLSIVGSSNFNERSRNRDSQFQFYIYSGCQELNSRLDGEWKVLQKDCKSVDLVQIESDPETKVNWLHRWLSKLTSSIL